MSGREIILIIRRDKDYYLNNEYKSSLNPWLIDIMELWNESFKMNIMDYRNRLKNIASSLYLKNKFDKIFLHSTMDLRNFKNNVSKNEYKLYENSIFVPMDEDDWIMPSLADELRNIETNQSIFIWNYFNTISDKEIISDKREKVLKRNQEERNNFVQSCCWATVGYYYILNKRNNLYIKQKEYLNAYFIPKSLAVKVEHVGSIGFLHSIIKGFTNQREKWIENIIKKLVDDIQIEIIDFSKIFREEWYRYKCLLKELLSSYKNLTDSQKELI
jgi:hypothetical protein